MNRNNILFLVLFSIVALVSCSDNGTSTSSSNTNIFSIKGTSINFNNNGLFSIDTLRTIKNTINTNRINDNDYYNNNNNNFDTDFVSAGGTAPSMPPAANNNNNTIQYYDTNQIKIMIKNNEDIVYAQFILGVMYDIGDGVPENDIKAHVWYSMAKTSGNEKAKKNLRILKTEMTKDQIAQAQELAAKCYESEYKGCD